MIYSWGKVTGGQPKASDDLSELKFVPIEELGGMLTTPLVRRVLEDAGFLSRDGQTTTAVPEPAQMNLILPADSVAFRQVGSAQPLPGARTVIPFCAPLKRIFAVPVKLVPAS